MQLEGRGLIGTLVIAAALAQPIGAYAAGQQRRADYDLDGCGDLVVGVPLDKVATGSGVVAAGSIHVVYGTTGGLSTLGDEVQTQEYPSSILDVSEEGDQFGAALAAADFNGDFLIDLAVGVPGEGFVSPEREWVGAVRVVYGARAGLGHGAESHTLYQCLPLPFDPCEGDDYFGAALAVGDVNADGIMDLAVGAWAEDLQKPGGSTVANAGAVNLFGGTSSGVFGAGIFLHQDSDSMSGSAEVEDRFGLSLAMGDFNGDLYDDLVVGIPGEDSTEGAIQVIYNVALGGGYNDHIFRQDDLAGDPEGSEGGDWFGWSLAAGDFDGDGVDDLAVGAPYENIGVVPAAGAVNVIYGLISAGLDSSRTQYWHQNRADIASDSELNDRFGWSLVVADFNGDGYDDLAISAPWEDHEHPGETIESAGVVHELHGSPTGLVSNSSDWWNQDTSSILDQAEANDKYGQGLGAGDYNCDGFDDLAVGVPYEDLELPSHSDAGLVNIIFGSETGLVAAGNQLIAQDFAGFAGNGGDDERFGYAIATAQVHYLFVGDFETGNTAQWSSRLP